MRKWLLLVLLLLCPLFQSVDAFWLVSYQTGERYQYAGGGMFFDEMGGEYMDLNQQVAIANAVMRIVCGDSRSYGGQK